MNQILKELDKPTINKKKNMKIAEFKALKDLYFNNDIVIKPADKGGSIVIMNTADYILEAERQLNNQDHYERLPEDPTQNYNTHINNLLNQAWRLNIIEQNTYTNLHTKHPRTPSFYLLPKIHKPNNPGRPIVNGIGSVTEKISAYVDTYLKKYTPRIPSHIKDTTHFLNILKHLEVQNTDLLVTIDVKSLYTNIPHTEGIAAITRMLEETNLDTLQRMFITNLAYQVLTKNYFLFNGQIYRQIQGTAMGTKMAPNYAIIFMHYLEQNLINVSKLKPKTWLRFIDDIFMIWPHGIQELVIFMEILNNQHPTIKFTYEYSVKEISFLDTIVYKTDSNKLYTKVFHKPTDNKQYLHFHSAHPRKQKESVPYGLLTRIRRICTEDKYFHLEAKKLISQLTCKKYPINLLTTAYTKVSSMSRNELLRPSKNKNDSKIRLVTNYNPNNPKIHDILKHHQDILLLTRKQAIKPEDIQVTYTRSPNIKDLLISSDLHKYHKPRMSQPCHKPRCKTCNQMETTQTITNNSNHTYPIRGNYNCQSTNIIYALNCMICGLQYVGESSNTMNTRCRGHVSTINTSKDHPVAIHYRSYNHTTEDFTISIIDSDKDKNRRLRLEEAWITLLDTLTPKGLNGRW